jgi:hypothetical protein
MPALAGRTPSPISRPSKIVDVGAATGHSTGDARRLPDDRCAPVSLVHAWRLPARGSCLRHQLSVLARSDRRFRPSDRLLWLCLRRLWPPWRKALMLVRPATVARWHREGLRRCWRRRSGRPGRPCIDSQLRALIRRLASYAVPSGNSVLVVGAIQAAVLNPTALRSASRSVTTRW